MPRLYERHSFKMHEIIPGFLYIRGRFDDLTANDKIIKLRNAGIKVVVAMCRTSYPEIGMSEIEYIHHEIPDGKLKYITIFKLQDLAWQLYIRILSGKKILVFCDAARNRSPIVAALVYRLYMGTSGEVALEHVRRVKPNTLNNIHFANYLEGLPFLRDET